MLTAPSLHSDMSEPCLLFPTHHFHSTQGDHCTHPSFHRQTAPSTRKTSTHREGSQLCGHQVTLKKSCFPQKQKDHIHFEPIGSMKPLYSKLLGKQGRQRNKGMAGVWRQREGRNKWSCFYNKEQQNRQTYRLSPSRTLGNTGEEGEE